MSQAPVIGLAALTPSCCAPMPTGGHIRQLCQEAAAHGPATLTLLPGRHGPRRAGAVWAGPGGAPLRGAGAGGGGGAGGGRAAGRGYTVRVGAATGRLVVE